MTNERLTIRNGILWVGDRSAEYSEIVAEIEHLRAARPAPTRINCPSCDHVFTAPVVGAAEVEQLRGEAEVADEQLAQLRGFAEAHKTCVALDELNSVKAEIEHLQAYQRQMNDILKENERLRQEVRALRIGHGFTEPDSIDPPATEPGAPPVDNDHVADGCEKFGE